MTTSGRSLSLRIAGGVACGLLALALNSFQLPMLGRESPAFAFGGALVIFAFWQLGLVPGLLAAGIGYAVASLPRELMFTMMALYALEGYVTARLTTRVRSLVVADVTFWLTLGVLLDLLAYRWWMDLSTGLVLLIIVKQLLNGVLNAAIAEGIARVAVVRQWVGAPPRTARPLTEVLFARTVPVVMLPMTIIVMLLARASYAAQYNQLAAELRRAATGVEEGAQRFLQSRHSSLGNFAMQLRMSRPASAELELTRFHDAHPEFVNIFITDAAGVVRYASPRASMDGLPFVGRDLSLRPYFDAARAGKRAVVGELVQGQLHVRRESAEPILPVAVPLYTDADAFDGIVMGALDANALRPLLSARLSSETGMAQMLDRSGHVVVSTSSRWKPGDARADELPSLFANDTTYPVALRSGTRESYADMLGVDPRITVVQPVSGFDFAALVDAPLSAVYAAMATTSLELLLLMLVALLAVHAVSRSLGAQLVGPLESIGAVATDLAGGHYAPREVLDRFDSSPVGEIRTLASQLGVMDDALRARHEADAARVAQSERKYRETLEQLAQAQKMEGIGRLAGGIAHDFNNLLTPIVGYTDLAMAAVPAGNPARRDLSLVRTAANRAKEVVAQLLAFGRAQVLDVHRIDLAETVAEFEPLLRRTLSADIELAVIAEPGVTVEADRAKVQQVLMNLVINAADAMSAGGRVEVRVGVEEVVETDPAEPEPLAPGTYGVIMVSDTGVGMDDETRLRAFDPFFTTKPRGKGTGLGLSTAYGIARQHRGTIRVESTAGAGTRMRVLLPLAAPSPYVSGENPVRTERMPEPVPQAAMTGATLMVVEDEGAVRELVRVALTRAGFRILAARDGDEALTRAAAHDGRIDLLLTDVVMPGLNGRELARRFRAARPEARVLFMSGYAADVISAEGVLSGDADLLVKPFSPDELVQRVRGALAR